MTPDGFCHYAKKTNLLKVLLSRQMERKYRKLPLGKYIVRETKAPEGIVWTLPAIRLSLYMRIRRQRW